MTALTAWALFAALAAVIGIAGYQLSRYADQVAELTGLGRNFVGIVMLATVTSLPELMSGVSAVAIVGDPNLAVGDVLGSCVFNLVLVVVLDVVYREGSVYKRATQGHLFSASLGMILISFTAFALLGGEKLPGFVLGHVGGFTALIPVLYLISLRALRRFEAQNASPPSEGEKGDLLRALAAFGISAAFVLIAGAALPFVAESIVHTMGWGSAFVGTIFLAFATSLPEIAVTISAIRLKAVELAFSNVLGSNLFNMVVLTVDDFFYLKGPLLRHVDPSHTLTALLAVMMTGLVSIALLLPPHRRVMNTVSMISVLLFGMFFLNAFLVWRG